MNSFPWLHGYTFLWPLAIFSWTMWTFKHLLGHRFLNILGQIRSQATSNKYCCCITTFLDWLWLQFNDLCNIWQKILLRFLPLRMSWILKLFPNYNNLLRNLDSLLVQIFLLSIETYQYRKVSSVYRVTFFMMLLYKSYRW